MGNNENSCGQEQRKKGYGDKLLNYIFTFAKMPIMLEVRECNIQL